MAGKPLKLKIAASEQPTTTHFKLSNLVLKKPQMVGKIDVNQDEKGNIFITLHEEA